LSVRCETLRGFPEGRLQMLNQVGGIVPDPVKKKLFCKGRLQGLDHPVTSRPVARGGKKLRLVRKDAWEIFIAPRPRRRKGVAKKRFLKLRGDLARGLGHIVLARKKSILPGVPKPKLGGKGGKRSSLALSARRTEEGGIFVVEDSDAQKDCLDGAPPGRCYDRPFDL